MSISAISTGSTFQIGGSNPMTQMKKSLDDLGSALKSGNLDDAKKAFAQLQKNAPVQGEDSKNPMSSEFESLKKALDSGDLKNAQEAYSKIEEKISQSPAASASAGGPPQGAPVDTVQLSSQNSSGESSTSDSKVYDKMDSDKDGTVTDQEKLAYEMKHANDATSASDTTSDKRQGKTVIEAYA
ncbi:MAG: hypothetical protein HY895_12515 [Deltaproteobacteria bacterium]|nr:hypothetical protein [Deltaproteobacteria bacterium]